MAVLNNILMFVGAVVFLGAIKVTTSLIIMNWPAMLFGALLLTAAVIAVLLTRKVLLWLAT